MGNKNKSIFFSLLILTIITTETKSPQKVIIASIPKCGTHLLMKSINLINSITHFMGDDQFRFTESDHLIASDNDIKNKKYILSHILPTKENIARLKKEGFKVIFIIRDPRAQAVSMINMSRATNWFPRLKGMPFDEALSHWMLNTSELYRGKEHWINKEILNFGNINDLYARYLPWTMYNSEFVYVTTFEKLAGPRSGGSESLQIQEIFNIAQHIGIDLTMNQALKVARSLHGPSKPGRKQISGWKKRFKEHHKELFKGVAGQLLIDLGYEKDLNW